MLEPLLEGTNSKYTAARCIFLNINPISPNKLKQFNTDISLLLDCVLLTQLPTLEEEKKKLKKEQFSFENEQ
jgi:hypothetical protein